MFKRKLPLLRLPYFLSLEANNSFREISPLLWNVQMTVLGQSSHSTTLYNIIVALLQEVHSINWLFRSYICHSCQYSLKNNCSAKKKKITSLSYYSKMWPGNKP